MGSIGVYLWAKSDKTRHEYPGRRKAEQTVAVDAIFNIVSSYYLLATALRMESDG